MSNLLKETVLEVHHWTDTLFTLKTTRDPGFRFENGAFAMLGLEVDGKPLLRAYSMASANYDEHLEFLSIKVPDGPLTSRLQHVKPGDQIVLNRKTSGTLLLENLLPGKRLYLLSTGTGIAPFLSLVQDPEVYERFDRVILTHTCRRAAELVFEDLLFKKLRENEFLGETVREKLTYYATTTREPYPYQGRITDLIRSGKLFADIDAPPLNVDEDRVMICGNPNMTFELRDYFVSQGFKMGGHEPGHFVIEKAFAER